MKAACVALFCLLPALGSAAAPEDFTQALNTSVWSGCVYQPGFTPYEIALTRQDRGFAVHYPGLCRGTQTRAIGDSADAAELIHRDETGVCVPMMMVDYSLSGQTLTLHFHGAVTATARLHPQVPGTAPSPCHSEDLTS